jgi:hypothetical protein
VEWIHPAGRYEQRNGTISFNTRAISLLAEQLLDSQEVFCSMGSES